MTTDRCPHGVDRGRVYCPPCGPEVDPVTGRERVPTPPFPNHERCLYHNPTTNLRCYQQAMNDEVWCAGPHRFDLAEERVRRTRPEPSP